MLIFLFVGSLSVLIFPFFFFYSIENFSHHATRHRTAPNPATPNPTPDPTPQTPDPSPHPKVGRGDRRRRGETNYHRRERGVDSRPGREEVANPLPEEGANALPEEVECEPPPQGSEGKPPPRGRAEANDHGRRRWWSRATTNQWGG